MAVSDGLDFDTWLSDRFRSLNTDETVFAPYIRSIVEGDECLDEKIDGLDGILGELGSGDLNVEAFRQEILTRWDVEKSAMKNGLANESSPVVNLESKLESILKMNDEVKESKQEDVSNEKGPKGLTSAAPDYALRAAILNQYRDDSDKDDSGGEGPSVSKTSHMSSSGGMSGLEKNTNAERVQSEIKDKREREKADAASKRAKDKEDRAKQKQQAQERKDKAKKKATKVERKR